MKDNAAIIVSILCLIHCIFTPLIVAAGIIGSISYILDESFIHIAMLVPVITLAFLSLPSSYTKHGSPAPIRLAAVGILAMIGALFIPEEIEVWVMVGAALLVISGHSLNKYLLKQSPALAAE